MRIEAGGGRILVQHAVRDEGRSGQQDDETDVAHSGGRRPSSSRGRHHRWIQGGWLGDLLIAVSAGWSSRLVHTAGTSC